MDPKADKYRMNIGKRRGKDEERGWEGREYWKEEKERIGMGWERREGREDWERRGEYRRGRGLRRRWKIGMRKRGKKGWEEWKKEEEEERRIEEEEEIDLKRRGEDRSEEEKSIV